MSIERRDSDSPKQILIEKLRALIYIESQKPVAEQDVELIDECVDYLMELEQGVVLTQKEIEDEKKKIYKLIENGKRPKKKRRFKALLLAACFLATVLIANLVAVAMGIDTISIYKQWGDRIINMFEGETAEFSEITIIKEDEFVFYKTIEEFKNSENLDVLYPSKLPPNTQLKKIVVGGSYDNSVYNPEYRDVFYVTDNTGISIIVHTNPNSTQKFLDNNLTVEVINGYECYIDFIDDCVQCTFVYRENTYVIKTLTYEEMAIIINNLKEILK